ncbi:MAG TPA: amidohydrolase family protein [Candidatus Thermoplasmatota archaeon]|nr:amidohydrolase family protein [Candidatus Thermoplasmatota archaeon]
MIIDCHMHLNNYSEVPVSLEERFQRLVAQLDKHSIDRGFVITSYAANERRPSITKVLDIVKSEPRLSVIEGMSLSGRAPFDLAATEERLRRGEVIGLKLYPGYEYFDPTDGICEAIYDLAMTYDVPVVIHTGDTYNVRAKIKYSHPLHIDEVAVDHPDLKIVMAHLGNPWFRDTAEIIYKNPNVYADISGLVLGDIKTGFEQWLANQVKEIIGFAGDPDKLLFGSDWPIVNVGPYLRLIDHLDLTDEEREKILWRNTAELFRIPESPPKAKRERKPQEAIRE